MKNEITFFWESRFVWNFLPLVNNISNKNHCKSLWCYHHLWRNSFGNLSKHHPKVLLYPVFWGESIFLWIEHSTVEFRKTSTAWQFCDCDLFGMVKTWPFQGLSDLHTRGSKGHFQSPGANFQFSSCHAFQIGDIQVFVNTMGTLLGGFTEKVCEQFWDVLKSGYQDTENLS